MSSQSPRRRVGVPEIRARKGGEPIVSLTAYTAPMARMLDPHVDFLLVGDSLGMEYHDYFLYHQGGNGRPRVALKSADAGAFFVEHLSQFEHVVVRHKGTSDERNPLCA